MKMMKYLDRKIKPSAFQAIAVNKKSETIYFIAID